MVRVSVITFGLNHQTAPLDLRGRLAFAPEQLAPALRGLNGRLQRVDPEAAIVSTCNRTELYLAVVGASTQTLLEPALDWLAEQGRVSSAHLQQHAYVKHDRDAARHAVWVAVASGFKLVGLHVFSACEECPILVGMVRGFGEPRVRQTVQPLRFRRLLGLSCLRCPIVGTGSSAGRSRRRGAGSAAKRSA